LIIAIVGCCAVAVSLCVRNVREVKTARTKNVNVDLRFPIGIELVQNSPVVSQGIVHISHVADFVTVAIDPVMKSGATLIGTILFVPSPFERSPTFKAALFNNKWHTTVQS
jgi:hypothetical protein